MTSRSSHGALASRDCAFASCTLEAEPGARYCREHTKGELQVDCKIEGCDRPANVRYDRGPFARLCAQHIEERREQMGRDARDRNGAYVGNGELVAKHARAVVPLAVKLDRLRGRLAQLPEHDSAKAAFDQASRRASVAPTPENLARVQATIRDLQKTQPKRTKIENDLAGAERALALAVQSLLRATRAPEAHAA